MASNLRSKIQPSDDMIIHDVNPTILEKFQKEFSSVGNVKIAESVREVAEQSVCACIFTTDWSQY